MPRKIHKLKWLYLPIFAYIYLYLVISPGARTALCDFPHPTSGLIQFDSLQLVGFTRKSPDLFSRERLFVFNLPSSFTFAPIRGCAGIFPQNRSDLVGRRLTRSDLVGPERGKAHCSGIACSQFISLRRFNSHLEFDPAPADSLLRTTDNRPLTFSKFSFLF